MIWFSPLLRGLFFREVPKQQTIYYYSNSIKWLQKPYPNPTVRTYFVRLWEVKKDRKLSHYNIDFFGLLKQIDSKMWLWSKASQTAMTGWQQLNSGQKALLISIFAWNLLVLKTTHNIFVSDQCCVCRWCQSWSDVKICKVLLSKCISYVLLS